MKIGIIGSARSRSTLLVEIVKMQNPTIPCYYEYYTYHSDNSIKNLQNLTEILFKNNNFIIKILGHNLKSNDVSLFNLKKYDQLHLIERYNFYQQCCSLQVAGDSKVWHSRNNLSKYNNIKLNKYYVVKKTIHNMANNISNYLKIKKYIVSNNLNFNLYNYDLLKNNKISNRILQDPKLDYKKIISNYNLHDQINDCFNKYFNYTTCQYNLECFLLEVNNILLDK